MWMTSAPTRWPLALAPLLLLIPLVAAADQAAPPSTQQVTAAPAGVIGPRTIGQGTFGEGATGWADPNSGAAQATYNFALPPARGLAQPQVTLLYNSNSGLGDAGPCWSFGLPVIERKAIQGGAPSYRTDDRFVFNGAPLVSVAEFGATSATMLTGETEQLPSWAKDWRYYRLQSDSHARFFWSRDGHTWRLQQKNGEILEFGYFDINGPEPLRWRLTRHFDHHCVTAPCTVDNPSNVVIYQWQRGPSGIAQLTDEYDTPPATSGAHDLSSFAHHTKITYEPNSAFAHDRSVLSQAPVWRAEPTSHVTAVEVTGNGHDGAKAPTSLHRYNFNYLPQAGGSRNAWALASIAEAGPASGTLPTTTFTYNDAEINLTPDPVTDIRSLWSTVPSGPPFPNPAKMAFMDVDRNGTVDVIEQPDDISQPNGRVYESAHDHNTTKLYYTVLNAIGSEQNILSPSDDISIATPTDLTNTASLYFGHWNTSSEHYYHYDIQRWRLARLQSRPDALPYYWKWVSPTSGPAARLDADFSFIAAGDIDGNGTMDTIEYALDAEWPVGKPPPTDPVRHRAARMRFFPRFAGDHDPDAIPFVETEPMRTANTAFGWLFNGVPYYAFADLNGDHVQDLVTVAEDGHSVTYYPGDAYGHFGCNPQTGICTLPPPDCIPIPSPVLPSPVNCYHPQPFVSLDGAVQYSSDRPTLYVDFNRDGLDDIVQTTTVDGKFTVRVFLNLDGRNFRSLDITPTFPTQPARVGLGDLNGNGTTDIIIVGTDGLSYVDPFPEDFSFQNSNYPGLLNSIDNGVGGKTIFTYKSLHQVESETAAGGGDYDSGWRGRSPVTAQVVSSVSHYQAPRGSSSYDSVRATYSYRQPAYDLWEGRIVGFGEVVETTDQAATKTKYYFGNCDDGCSILGETDPNRPLLGVPYQIDVSSNNGDAYSTTTFHYSMRKIYKEIDGQREVGFSHPDKVETYLYDNAPFQPASQNISIALTDAISIASTLPSTNREHLRKWYDQDSFGNPSFVLDWGRVSDDGVAIDSPISTAYGDWKLVGSPDFFLFAPGSQSITGTSAAGDPVDHDRSLQFSYGETGDVTDITATLAGTLPLTRSHEHGDAIAPAPPGASVDGVVHVAHFDYDYAAPGAEPTSHVGNVTRSLGPGSISCVERAYDTTYQHLATSETSHTSGCGGNSLTQTWTYSGDSFDLPSTITHADHSVSMITYDTVGRIQTVADSDADFLGMASSQASQLSYNWRPSSLTTGYSGFSVRVPTSATQTSTVWQYVDGFGQNVASIAQGDAADDGAPWIVQGATGYYQGRPTLTYRPYGSTTDPTQLQLPLPASYDGQVVYDGVGRVVSAVERGRRVQMKHHALSTDIYDEEDLRDGSHTNTPTTITRDGHGRIVSVTERNATQAGMDLVQTNYGYNAAGQVVRITKQHNSGADPITRWMQYDSLGRLVLNAEPNTSKNFVADAKDPKALTDMRAWRYAYDDAGRMVGTSDARGCGKNRFYDGLGRLLAEDYSPCLAHHETYTPIDLVHGAGAETLYQYDAAGLIEGPGYYGRLTWTADRGAVTYFGYDGRGRIKETARRITRPASSGPSAGQDSGGLDLEIGLGPIHIVLGGGGDSSGDAGAGGGPGGDEDRYGTHLFRKRLSYDLVNRVVSEESGADVDELLGADGASAVQYVYSGSGRLQALSSSYGPLVSKMTYNFDGTPGHIAYGDAAGTTAAMHYDSHDIDNYSVSRGHPPLWDKSVSPYYQKADSSPPSSLQQTLTNLSFLYDGVGNPTAISDARDANEWPAGAMPKKNQTLTYDDLYRLTSENVEYGTSDLKDDQVSPFAAEEEDISSPVLPRLVRAKRSTEFDISYDFAGNTTSLNDNDSTVLDRSALGTVTNGDPSGHPNRLTASSLGIQVRYDDTGNVVEMLVPRTGDCTAFAGRCSHHFVYDWDEIGQLVRARRWDYAAIPSDEPSYPEVPFFTPDADVRYAYSQGQRVLRSSTPKLDFERHSAEVFGTLRLDGARWEFGDYEVNAATESAYLAGLAHVVVTQEDLPAMSSSQQHVFLMLGDKLGSTNAVIDYDTGELAEDVQYHPYGTVDSDYRPERWKHHRELYQFTGKESDTELGLIYFGARYYSLGLARWLSADPLTVHAAGSDLNPYAYVGGSPRQRVDPVGLCDELYPWCGAIPIPNIDPAPGQGGGGSGTYQGDNGNPGQKQQFRSPSGITASPKSTAGPGQGTWLGIEPSWFGGSTRSGYVADVANEFNAGVDKNATVIVGTGALAGAQAAVIGATATGGFFSSAFQAVSRGWTSLGQWAAGKAPWAVGVSTTGTAVASGLNGNSTASSIWNGAKEDVAQLRLGAGAAGVDDFVDKVVNSNMPHAAERAVERAGFSTVQEARTALQQFGADIQRAGTLPGTAIQDTAHADRIIIPFGKGGGVVYQVRNGVLKLKTVLEWRDP